MTKQEVIELIEKYQNGTASARERGLLESWYNEHAKSADQLPGFPDDMWVRQDQSLDEIQREGIRDPKKIKLWPRIAVVAAAVTAITLGVWLYYASVPSRSLSSRVSRDLYANDIAPGRNTATITFDNGEAVALNNKELDISSATVEPLKEGAEVASETPQFLASHIARSKTIMLSTPRGGQYQVVLPDGTKVWLNADSKISFPSQFFGRQRKIHLSGEAYFEVAHNKAKPFMVESAGQEVTVLGTHFNINSYADEGSTKTTLLEGAVRISTADQQGVVLKPGQQASLKGERLQVKQVNAEDAISWKAGYFVFKSTPLEAVMKQVERWYNVETVYADERLKSSTFSGAASRYENVSIILKTIENTGEVKFKIEGRRVIVTR